MIDRLEIRSYRPGDEAQILALFRQSYGHDMSLDYWKWRFRNSPAGPGVIYLAWDGDVLAAHYAVTAVIARIRGDDWPTGLSGTTMTHPDYRGRGLFPVLARATYEYMAEVGMAMVWGFPNALSHRGFVRDLDWVDIYEVPTLRGSLATRSRLPLAGDTVVELATFDFRFDSLWARVEAASAIAVKRDRAYLTWRYAENTVEKYRILACVDGAELGGYAVSKHFGDELQVVDLVALDEDIGLVLVSRVAEEARQQGAEAMSLWLKVAHPLHHALERVGFVNGMPVTYLGARALQPQLTDAGLYDYRNWYLTMGDSDVF